jgi:hypothetical protein
MHLAMYDVEGTDPTRAVESQIQQFHRRPLLIGAAILAIVGYGAWYMTGGSATGSTREAEAAIRANPFPGNPTHPAVITVQCTQDGQPFFARLQNLIHPVNNAGQHGNTDGPNTTYTCSGTTTAGQPAYWCVSFAPRDSSYTGPPTVAARSANEPCS